MPPTSSFATTSSPASTGAAEDDGWPLPVWCCRLKSDYRNVTVAVDSIVYIESVGNYVKVHLADGSTLMSKLTLTHLLALLPAGEFLRIHRSFAVALNRLERFSATEVMIAGKVLPVGRKFASSLPAAPQS